MRERRNTYKILAWKHWDT